MSFFFQGEIDSLQACVFSTDGALIVSGASTLCFGTDKKKTKETNKNDNEDDGLSVNAIANPQQQTQW